MNYFLVREVFMIRQSLMMYSTLVLFAATLVACGSGSKGNSAANNVGVQSCSLAGQVYIASYNGVTYNSCYSSTSCTQYGINYGYIPQVGCAPGVLGSGGGLPGGGTKRHLYGGDIQLNAYGQVVYRDLIKDQGICSSGKINGWNNLNCDQWDDRAHVDFEVMSDGTLPAYSYVDVTAYSDNNTYYPYKFTFQGMATPINNNSAFAIQALGGPGYGYNKYFKLQGDVGALISGSFLINSFNATITYNGLPIGTALMVMAY